MVRIGVLVVAILMVSFSASGRAADTGKLSPEEAQKKAQSLVRKLGDPAFRQRESAAKELISLGGFSRVALEAALNDPDAEIRERCRRLLPMALEADIRAQLKDFLADSEGNRECTLPGWKSFSTTIGKDPLSRKFYATMLQKNLDLLQNLELNPKKTLDAYRSRCADIYNSQYNRAFLNVNGAAVSTNVQPMQPDIHEIAALLFIGMDEKIEKLSAAGQNNDNYIYQVSNLLYLPLIKTYLGKESDSPSFKKVFLRWLELQATPTSQAHGFAASYGNVYAALQLIQMADFKEAIDVVEKIASMKGGQSISRAQALCTLGKIGSEKQVKFLEPFLKDESLVGTINFGGLNAKPITVQVRDIALGVTVYLSGQKMADYEFDGLKSGRWGRQPNGVFYYYMFGFENDENRKKTFDKWNDFLAKKSKDEKKSESKPKAESAQPSPSKPVPVPEKK